MQPKIFITYGVTTNGCFYAVDEKPFKCSWDNCDRAFKRRESLTDHIKRHKNIPLKV